MLISHWRKLVLLLVVVAPLAGCNVWATREPAVLPGDLLLQEGSRNEVHAKLSTLADRNAEVNARLDPNQALLDRPGPKGRGLIESRELRVSPGGAIEPKDAGAPEAEDDAVERTEVTLEFSDVSLRELLQVILDEYLQVPYTILDSFQDKKVNFVYRAKASKEELLAVLEAFLGFHGVSLVYSNGVYAVTTDAKKVKGQPAELGLGWVAGAFKMNYLGAKDFLNVARQFLEQPTNALELPGTDSVFIYAPGSQFKAVQMLHERLDLPYFDGKHLIVYSPRFLSVGALKALIENFHKMLGATSKQGNKLFEVEAIKELNELVIVAADAAARDQVLQFLRSTDRPGGNTWQAFQYVLTNQKSGEMLSSVKNLVKALFKDEARAEVVADKGSNSLFVTATPEDYAQIVKLIERLDYRPPAVHIEVSLVEVILTDSMKYGVEWFLFGDSGDYRSSGSLDLGKNLLKGLTLDVVNLSNDKFLTLEALAEETDFRILANPQLVVKNGSTANLLVGQEIAIEKATLETNTAGSSAKTEFERRDVAITLEVTPTIGADQQIQIILRLNDERDVGRDINGQPIFAKREIKTDLVAYDGDTLFIGGIIRERTIQDEEKVPILGDLAYVGATLFGNQEVTKQRTELIMLVTPRLVLDDEGANLLTQAIVGAETMRRDAAPVMGPTPGRDSFWWTDPGGALEDSDFGIE